MFFPDNYRLRNMNYEVTEMSTEKKVVISKEHRGRMSEGMKQYWAKVKKALDEMEGEE